MRLRVCGAFRVIMTPRELMHVCKNAINQITCHFAVSIVDLLMGNIPVSDAARLISGEGGLIRGQWNSLTWRNG